MIYLHCNTHDVHQVTKVGGTNKANRIIQIARRRETLEASFMKQAKQAHKDETNALSKATKQSKRLAYREAKRLR